MSGEAVDRAFEEVRVDAAVLTVATCTNEPLVRISGGYWDESLGDSGLLCINHLDYFLVVGTGQCPMRVRERGSSRWS